MDELDELTQRAYILRGFQGEELSLKQQHVCQLPPITEVDGWRCSCKRKWQATVGQRWKPLGRYFLRFPAKVVACWLALLTVQVAFRASSFVLFNYMLAATIITGIFTLVICVGTMIFYWDWDSFSFKSRQHNIFSPRLKWENDEDTWRARAREFQAVRDKEHNNVV